MRPDLCWISASYIHDDEEFIRLVRDLQKVFTDGGKERVVLGGRALGRDLRLRLEHVVVLDDMRSLYEFQDNLRAR
jgi:hypothetical protein